MIRSAHDCPTCKCNEWETPWKIENDALNRQCYVVDNRERRLFRFDPGAMAFIKAAVAAMNELHKDKP